MNIEQNGAHLNVIRSFESHFAFHVNKKKSECCIVYIFISTNINMWRGIHYIDKAVENIAALRVYQRRGKAAA